MEFALRGKAVRAVQVAGVGDVQTQRLHDRAPLLEVKCLRLVDILREQLPGLRQLFNLPENLLRISLGIALLPGRNQGVIPVDIGRKSPSDLFPRLARVEKRDRVITHVVYHMDAAGKCVKNDIVAIQSVLMNHPKTSQIIVRDNFRGRGLCPRPRKLRGISQLRCSMSRCPSSAQPRPHASMGAAGLR